MFFAFLSALTPRRKTVQSYYGIKHIVYVYVEREKDECTQGLIQEDLCDGFLQFWYFETFLHPLSYNIEKGVPQMDEWTREK